MVQCMSSLRRDFFASHLRTQVDKLKCVLDSVESKDDFEDERIEILLKQVERNLRQLRKVGWD